MENLNPRRQSNFSAPAHQPQHALLDAVEQSQLLAAVPLGDAHDQAQVRGHHLLAGPTVAALDALCELHFLIRREQWEAAQLAQEQAERVGCGAQLGVPVPDLLRKVATAVVADLDPAGLDLLEHVRDTTVVEVEGFDQLADLGQFEAFLLAPALQQELKLLLVLECCVGTGRS